MHLAINVDITCQLTAGDAVLMILEAAQTDGQTVQDASLDVVNATLRRVDGMPHIWATDLADTLTLSYRATVEVTRQAATLETLNTTPLPYLPGSVLPFLLPSRFCQSDLFTDFAELQFGALRGGAKIAAIRDWVAAEITYRDGASNGATTATDTFAVREGVCRDFAHLVCTLARASGIPARYTSVYGPDVTPPNFHAVAEVYLSDAWHLIDATGMGTASDLVIIASGRDAADVAVLETAHWAQPIHQSVDVTRLGVNAP